MFNYHTSEIYVYPVKSVGAVKMNSIDVYERGLRFDRHWMIIRTNGTMISQREFPQLNKIQCEDMGDSFRFYVADSSYPEIKVDKSDDLQNEIVVDLWGAQFNAFRTQNRFAEWFSDYLSEKTYVVVNPERIKQLATISKPSYLNFQDGGPVHLVNLSSVHDLSEQSQSSIHPMQFRANIYIDFKTPYFEDHLEKLIINDIAFKVVKPCERCIMINLPPLTDQFSKEPLLSLSKFRKQEHKVQFGLYLAIDS